MSDYKRYWVKLPSQHIRLISKLNISKLKNDGENLVFYTDSEGINKLQSLEIEFESRDLFVSKIKYLFTKRLISVISVILLIVLLINQSFTITKYEFVNPENYDPNVIIFLEKNFYNIGPFRYLKKSISEINYELRTEFFEYEWIGLRKEGTVLYIDIKKIDVKIIEPEDNTIVGDLVASKDAIVRYFIAQKGVVLVRELQAVEKGEVLITGNLLIHNEQVKYIRPKGFVVGEVIESYHFTIPKVEVKEEKSGRLIERNKLLIFNKGLLTKKDEINFKEYILIENEKFKLGKIIKFINQTYYETIKTVNYYTKEEALEYAKSLIVRDFNAKKTTKYEKIIFIEILCVIEGKDNYEIMLLAKKLENIAVFQEVKVD